MNIDVHRNDGGLYETFETMAHRAHLRSGVVLGNPGLEQTDAQTFSESQSVKTIGGLPSDLLPKIAQLAEILQQKFNDGTLEEARIQQELYQGDLATVIKDSVLRRAGYWKKSAHRYGVVITRSTL